MIFLMLAGGLVLLVVGGELLVRGAVRCAAALGVSPLVIGLTLVGFGTSTPELVTSLQAAMIGSPGVAVGNVVGSNICNILLILGLAAVIRPVSAAPEAFRRDGPALVAATLACLAVLATGALNRWVGVAFVAALLGYIGWAYVSERRAAASAAAAEGRLDTPVATGAALRALPVAVAGLALVIVGAGWLVDAAISLAQGWGVSDALIGLTIVAVGTSLPELTASVAAAARGQSDVAFGNVVGSNIYNILGILGVTAAVQPLEVPASIAGFDGWVMAAATVALVVATVTSWKVTRGEGALMLAAYGGYLAVLIAAA